MKCCVCGCHIFKSFCDAPIGSVLSSKHEDDPQSLFYDKYAIALINSELVAVGHLPKFVSKLTHFFVKHAGKIRCEITGSKRYSSDLEQGGLEIPAKIIFQNSSKRIIDEMKKKLAPLIKEYNKKTLTAIRTCNQIFKKDFIH